MRNFINKNSNPYTNKTTTGNNSLVNRSVSTANLKSSTPPSVAAARDRTWTAKSPGPMHKSMGAVSNALAKPRSPNPFNKQKRNSLEADQPQETSNGKVTFENPTPTTPNTVSNTTSQHATPPVTKPLSPQPPPRNHALHQKPPQQNKDTPVPPPISPKPKENVETKPANHQPTAWKEATRPPIPPTTNRPPLLSGKIMKVSKKKTTTKKIENSNENSSFELRSKPLNKPKPNPERSYASREEPKKKEEQDTKTEQNHLNISSKWAIHYEELEFDELVSTGSAGEVYMGYYFGTPVAIKKLFSLGPDQRHLVEREYSMLSGVNHPNIVQFLGLCDHETGIYLITEYVEHGDLFDMLVFGDEKLDWKTKVKIALQIAQACFYLHSRGVLHRDLKSQNVLIGENHKVKLCDLGLATLIENSKKRTTVCGTNEWMAPEIMTQPEYDNKVDVFSFGVVLQELITNGPPPKREISKQLAFDVDHFIRYVPEDCPEPFAALVIDCTKFKPEDRPTFKEIVPRLRKLHDSLV